MATAFTLMFLSTFALGTALPLYNRPGYRYRPQVSAFPAASQPQAVQDELSQAAERKREYQAAYAYLASKTAPITMGQPSANFVLQPTKNLYRPQKPLAVTVPVFVPTRQQYPGQKAQGNVLFQPASVVYHGVQQGTQRPSVQRGAQRENVSEQSVGVLPNGHLEDTEEVKAAKREHFAAVAKAQAVAARAEKRRQMYPGHVLYQN